MAMRGGMYNANKRKKELARKKKQDEKREKRQKAANEPSQDIEGVNPAAVESEVSEDQSVVTEVVE